MSLIELKNVSLHFGHQVLLDEVEFNVEKGQRICLIGRNGAGKSTLLKVLDDQIQADDGSVWRAPTLKIARLQQELPDADDKTVFEVVASGLEKAGSLLAKYGQLSLSATTDSQLSELSRIQQEIEAIDGWALQQRVETIISRLQLPGDAQMSELSGGWRRRVALGRAMVVEPDLLLLDEPTNHLDIESIEWLQNWLLSYQGGLVFITHDRSMLQAVANHIVELDRGHLRRWEGDYRSFLEFREQQLLEEERHNALFDKRLAEEERWIRQGIKARRTRNEGRVRALKEMREQRLGRRNRQGDVSFDVNGAGLSGKLVASLEGVHQSYEKQIVIDNFSCNILRGDRVGLIGPNGAGKSTLLKIILGLLQPQRGQVRVGTNLEVAYFDQLRDELDLEKNAIDNVSEGRDSVQIGDRSRHIMSYLGDFLFTGERARTPLKVLSGGERNRVMLAKLFSKPSNLLVLDEPTNDLDVETLELFEEILSRYEGTLLIVSHDREFLDNVVTSTIAFEGKGRVREYVGGFSDWVRQGGNWDGFLDSGAELKPGEQEKQGVQEKAAETPPVSSAAGSNVSRSVKLSYKLQRELDGLPAAIEALEKDLELLEQQVAQEGFYQQEHQQVTEVLSTLSDVQQELEEKYGRWDELEAMTQA